MSTRRHGRGRLRIRTETLLSLVALALTLYEWTLAPPESATAWWCSVAHIVALSAVVFMPLHASTMVVFVFCCSVLLPYGTGISQYWGIWVALSILGDHRFRKNGIVMLLVSVVSRMLKLVVIQASDDSPAIAITCCASLAFAYCVGGLLRKKVDAERRITIQAQDLDKQRREQRLAATIHDAVSSDLAYAVLLSQDENLPQEKIIAEMRRTSRKAMESLYGIIDGLDDSSDTGRMPAEEIHESDGAVSDAADGNVHDVDELRRWLDANEARLSRIGLDGTISISGDTGQHIPQAVYACLTGLVQELFANIMKYAKVESKYFLRIRFAGNAVSVVQTNAVDADARKPVGPHGYGLAVQRRRIARLGGTVNSCMEDGSWTLFADIPYKGHARIPGHGRRADR